MIIVSDDAPLQFARNLSHRAKRFLTRAASAFPGTPLGLPSERMLDDIAFRENAAANQVRW